MDMVAKQSFISAVATKMGRNRNIVLDTLVVEWARSLGVNADKRGVMMVAAKVAQHA